MSRVCGSQSTKRGIPPAWITAAAVAKNVLEGTRTCFPPTPKIRKAISRAAVPLLTAQAKGIPTKEANSSSKCLPCEPRVSCPDNSTSFILPKTSSISGGFMPSLKLGTLRRALADISGRLRLLPNSQQGHGGYTTDLLPIELRYSKPNLSFHTNTIV
jgi:hypothetical protein